MKIAIMGSGGVGGYYGARLAGAGHDVHFIARGIHAEAMRANGLRVESGAGNLTLERVHVVEGPEEIGDADLIVIAVKLWDTEAAAKAVLPLVGRDTCVVSLQNGVEKDETIGAVVGREHVLGGVTYIIARISEPGVIAHSGTMHRVLVGELDGKPSDRVARVVSAFTDAGVNTAASSDIRRDTWEKFAFLAASAGVTAVTRLPMGPVRSNPATRSLLRVAIAEVVAVAQAEGVAIADDFVDLQLRFVDSLPPAGRASMATDLLRGSRLELEWLSGAVVRHGERAGVPTPVHRVIYGALAPYANGSPQEEGASA